jgi:hypothetical protein
MPEAKSRRKKVDEGDLLAIKVGERTFAGKVLFTSEIFRDVVLLAIYLSESNGREPDLLLYTVGSCIGSSGWGKIGSEAVTDAERKLSKRIVGGEVWLGDTELGPAQRSEWKSLPKMEVYGCKAVEIELRTLLDR